MKRLLIMSILISFCGAAVTWGQVLPDGIEAVPYECPPPKNLRQPTSEAERLELKRRAKYRAVLPAYFSAVAPEPDATLQMPVEGIRVGDVANTWDAARGGSRLHEGQDIFAPEGTPIYSAAAGFVYRIGQAPLGGNIITVIGGGGRRFYYAHLQSFAADLREGQIVTTDTLLGYVGNTGNAATTPHHLHFGVYEGDIQECDWDAINPLPLLVDRE
jgi:peptidoglycan LD-endopeptidase LytH